MTMKHEQFYEEDINVLKRFLKKVKRFDTNTNKSGIIYTRYGYYDSDNTFIFMADEYVSMSFILRYKKTGNIYADIYHISQPHKEYKKQILEKLMYRAMKQGEKKMPRKVTKNKTEITTIPPIPTITEKSWEDATDEHTLIYALTFSNGTRSLLRFQGQREPEESILVETLLNEEQHERVILTNRFEFDGEGNYRKNSRNRLQFQAYRFWHEHNVLNWRFADPMHIIGVSERDFIDTFDICCFPFDIFESSHDKVQSGCVVTLDLEITHKDTLTTYNKVLTYLHGAFNIDVSLEQALENAVVGGVVDVTTKEMYGKNIQNNVETFAPTELEIDLDYLQIGQVVQFADEKGWTYEGRVSDINVDTETIFINFNSPWVDNELHVRAEVVCIRPATNEELEAGVPFGLTSEEANFEDDDE